MTTPDQKQALKRHEMIETQLVRRGITDSRVLEAFEEVPRHHFVPAEYISEAYADHPTPIGAGQTISQPYIVALTLQELAVQPGDTVLDIGAGSGYQTALLATLAKHVYAVEYLQNLAAIAKSRLKELGFDNVTLVSRDGSTGWPDHAPYDRIVCGAASPKVPQPWVEQLADKGRIVTPVADEYMQTLIVLEKQGDQLERRDICGVRFVKLLGEYGFRATT